MLARGPAAEVAAREKDRSSLEAGIVEGMIGILLAIVLEGMFPEAVEGDAAEVAAGMMRSVSISSRGRGTTRPVTCSTFCIIGARYLNCEIFGE